MFPAAFLRAISLPGLNLKPGAPSWCVVLLHTQLHMGKLTCQTNSRRFSKWLLPCFLLSWSHLASAGDIRESDTSASDSSTEAEFTQAVKRFKEGDFVPALESFMALRTRTQSPNVHLYIGHCYLQLGRPTEAYRAFTLAIEQTNRLADAKYDATRIAAQEQLSLLNLRLSRLTISLVKASQEVVVKLDGRPLEPGQLDLPLTIEPGVHVVEAEATGKESVVKSIALEKGSNKTVALLLRNQPAQPEPSASTNEASSSWNSESSVYTNLGWTAAGVGFAGWGLFTVAGLRAKSVYENLRAECASPCSDATHRDDASSGRTWQTAANIGLAVGILGTVSAVTLFGVGATRGGTQRSMAGLHLGPHSAQVSFGGRF